MSQSVEYVVSGKLLEGTRGDGGTAVFCLSICFHPNVIRQNMAPIDTDEVHSFILFGCICNHHNK